MSERSNDPLPQSDPTHVPLFLMTTEELSAEGVCLICGVGDDGRHLCHFHSNDECPEEIVLHVFCGKTAAILPHVNRPDLEILTKAGIKNKHGTGVSVTLALQRCRSARVNDPSNREQEYYLSKEFERIYLAVTKEPAHQDELENEHLTLENMVALQSQTVPNPISSTSDIMEASSVSPESLDYLHHEHRDDEDLPSSKRHKPANSHKSPYDIAMEHLQLICDRCSGVGYSLIRGVARGTKQNDDEDDDDDEIADDDDFDPTECSQEQVDHVRVIIITKERQDRMEEMSKLILGEQHGQDFMTFNTSFSNRVISAWNAFTVRFQQALEWQEKFDLLLGFTDTLKEHDFWMNDHEVGWGGEKMVEQLGRSWKLMLERGNDELGIDSEYTRPGVVALLEQFKEAIESVESLNPHDPNERMHFDFET